MNSLSLDWNPKPVGRLPGRSTRAYFKALRAAEQAAWERQLPAVEAARWQADGEQSRPAVSAFLGFAVVLVLAASAVPGSPGVLAGAWTTCRSWLEILTG